MHYYQILNLTYIIKDFICFEHSQSQISAVKSLWVLCIAMRSMYSKQMYMVSFRIVTQARIYHQDKKV